jgi:intein/homing endonuclease
MSFILFYNYQKKLKSLKFKSPFSLLLEKFDKMPSLFKDNPYYKLVGLNNYYTKLPQILEPEKEYSKIDIIKEVISKIKQTPIRELPKKIIKKLKRD